MGLFKKKGKPVATELTCPVEGCYFICPDHISLKRHLEWKHPDLKTNTIKPN